MWERAGMRVVTMSAHHYDKVLAVTSHLPHLIGLRRDGANSPGPANISPWSELPKV
jgi:hypothetical protein